MKDNIQHNHLIIRAETLLAPEESAQAESLLNSTLAELIESIGMKVVLAPRAVYVGAEGNEGYTGQAGLETSHFAYHIWNKPDSDLLNSEKAKALFQVDLYTCGKLGEDELIKVVQWIDRFDIVLLEYRLYDRSESIDELESGYIPEYSREEYDIRTHINRRW